MKNTNPVTYSLRAKTIKIISHSHQNYYSSYHTFGFIIKSMTSHSLRARLGQLRVVAKRKDSTVSQVSQFDSNFEA